VTLVVGLAVGYAVGDGQGRGTVAAPEKPTVPVDQAPGGVASATIIAVTPPASIDNFGPVLTQNPGTCSVQVGHDLELGIPVTNQSGETVLLDSVKPVSLASDILKVLSWHWDPCGFDNDGTVPDTVVALGPGETNYSGCPIPAA
jgi:hypothetical protein